MRRLFRGRSANSVQHPSSADTIPEAIPLKPMAEVRPPPTPLPALAERGGRVPPSAAPAHQQETPGAASETQRALGTASLNAAKAPTRAPKGTQKDPGSARKSREKHLLYYRSGSATTPPTSPPEKLRFSRASSCQVLQLSAYTIASDARAVTACLAEARPDIHGAMV